MTAVVGILLTLTMLVEMVTGRYDAALVCAVLMLGLAVEVAGRTVTGAIQEASSREVER